MGNCFGTRWKVDKQLSAQATPGVSRLNSRNNFSPSLSLTEADNGNNVPRIRSTLRTESDILSSPYLKAFAFAELKNATRNFRSEYLIGEGGFGYVYKGWLDEKTLVAERPGCGMVVAVKKFKPESFQGHKEWLSEVNYLGQLHHPNLVKLIGYCLEEGHRLLVYEYLTNGSLENHLFGWGAQPLSWATRIKVAIDAARGLSFLHDSDQPIIYRDFKASNILLDSEFNAKLSDFGLAKAGPTGDHSHVSTQVLGTQGYAAPEYFLTGRLTARCDVYSFGVVLMELLSGRRAVDKTRGRVEENLVEWAKPYLSDRRKLYRIMDAKLEGQYPQRAAFSVAILALQCISEAKGRPCMPDVLSTLEKLPSHSYLNVSSHSEAPWRNSNPSSPANMLNRGCLLPSPTERKLTQNKSPRKVISSQRGQFEMNSLHHVKPPQEQVSSETKSPCKVRSSQERGQFEIKSAHQEQMSSEMNSPHNEPQQFKKKSPRQLLSSEMVTPHHMKSASELLSKMNSDNHVKSLPYAMKSFNYYMKSPQHR